jgi:hypothetical protein
MPLCTVVLVCPLSEDLLPLTVLRVTSNVTWARAIFTWLVLHYSVLFRLSACPFLSISTVLDSSTGCRTQRENKLFVTWCTAAGRQRIKANGFLMPYDLFSLFKQSSASLYCLYLHQEQVYMVYTNVCKFVLFTPLSASLYCLHHCLQVHIVYTIVCKFIHVYSIVCKVILFTL